MRNNRSSWWHLLRIALVGALLGLLDQPTKFSADDANAAPNLSVVRLLLPDAVRVGAFEKDRISLAYDPDDREIGRLARTRPEASAFRGYHGPTEALLSLDKNNRVIGIAILSSQDTTEHVAAVASDTAFFKQFEGLTLGNDREIHAVDGVSGATLTSLALAGGVFARCSSGMIHPPTDSRAFPKPSLVFAKPLEATEAIEFAKFAFADPKLVVSTVDGVTATMVDLHGRRVGDVLRSGGYDDATSGFQGPTEILMAVKADETLAGIKIRDSFDNEPYVDYVRTDRSFVKLLRGKRLVELSEIDLAKVEGVSGATVTSQAVVATLVRSVQRLRTPAPIPSTNHQPFQENLRWSWAEIATGLVSSIVVFIRKKRMMRKGWVRRIWLIAVIIVLGVWSGNLISLSLISGWISGGIAWRIAPGLALLFIWAFVMPALARDNVYCSHLCPHGALQQLIRPKVGSPRLRRMPGRIHKLLTWIPFVTLTFAYVVLTVFPTTDLASWEPFHSYRYPIAGTVTLVIFGISLMASGLIPMAYCQYGCPTGSFIGYLRKNAKSGEWQRSDWILLALLAFGISYKFL